MEQTVILISPMCSPFYIQFFRVNSETNLLGIKAFRSQLSDKCEPKIPSDILCFLSGSGSAHETLHFR